MPYNRNDKSNPAPSDICQINIYITREERDALDTVLKKHNLSRSGALRSIIRAVGGILDLHYTKDLEGDLRMLLTQFRGEARNINQMAKISNMDGRTHIDYYRKAVGIYKKQEKELHQFTRQFSDYRRRQRIGRSILSIADCIEGEDE